MGFPEISSSKGDGVLDIPFAREGGVGTWV